MFASLDRFLKSNELEKYLNKQYFNYLVLIFTLMFSIYLNWGIKEVGGLILFVYILLWQPKSELLAKGALFSLIMVPLLLVLRRETRAEDFASLAYILLVATVILALSEKRKTTK